MTLERPAFQEGRGDATIDPVTAPESPAPLAVRLREALTESGLSQRALAKLIADEAGTDPENERRQLLRHLAAENAPDDERARLYARLLKKPDDYFIDERSPRAQLLEQMMGMIGLIDDLRALVEERLPEGAEEGAVDLMSIDRRLAELEATVAEQGRATTKALEALTAGIRRLERQQAPAAPRAKKAAR